MSEPLIQFGKQAEGPANGAIPAARVKLPAPPRPASSTVSVDGVVIREIRRDGLVLSLRGRDVLLPRP